MLLEGTPKRTRSRRTPPIRMDKEKFEADGWPSSWPRPTPPPGFSDRHQATPPADTRKWWQTAIDRGFTYLEKKDAQKRADSLKAQGVEAQVTQRTDGTFAVEEKPPFWKNPLVIAGAGVGALVLVLLLRPRSNPPRRRRRRR